MLNIYLWKFEEPFIWQIHSSADQGSSRWMNMFFGFFDRFGLFNGESMEHLDLSRLLLDSWKEREELLLNTILLNCVCSYFVLKLFCADHILHTWKLSITFSEQKTRQDKVLHFWTSIDLYRDQCCLLTMSTNTCMLTCIHSWQYMLHSLAYEKPFLRLWQEMRALVSPMPASCTCLLASGTYIGGRRQRRHS